MAGSLNKVTLIGNVGRDPEIRTMQNGGRVANLSIATNESWKDKTTGERRDKTEWHRVVIFNEGLVNVVEKYIQKGTKLYIEGQLETRKWTDSATGQDRYTTEIVIKPFRGELVMLDSRGANEPNQNNSFYEQAPPMQAQASNAGPGPIPTMPSAAMSANNSDPIAGKAAFPAESAADDFDDEIPF